MNASSTSALYDVPTTDNIAAMHRGIAILRTSAGRPPRTVFRCVLEIGDHPVHLGGETLGAIMAEIDIAVARLTGGR